MYMSIINDIHYLDCQVDFAMDVFKNLYPDQDVPEGLLILFDSMWLLTMAFKIILI